MGHVTQQVRLNETSKSDAVVSIATDTCDLILRAAGRVLAGGPGADLPVSTSARWRPAPRPSASLLLETNSELKVSPECFQAHL